MATRVDATDFGCALAVSGDGGEGWIPVNPVPEIPREAERCYAPEVAFDGKGRLYYLFVGLRGISNLPVGVYLTTSDDRAITFSRPRKVLGPNNFQVRMTIAHDEGSPGRLHLTWLAAREQPGLGSLPAPPNPIMHSFSDDGARSFSRPVQVNKRSRLRVVAPAVALGDQGDVHVLYYDLGDDAIDYHGLEGPAWEGQWLLVLSSSADGGRSFGREAVVEEGVVPPERVMLVFTMPPPSLVASGGRVHAAWHDARNGDWDAFAVSSEDSGRSWSSSVRLGSDPVASGRHQYLPRLAVAPDGRLDAIWYDRREDPTNRRNDVFYSHSADGGRTFDQEVKVTSRSSDSRVGQTYAGPAAVGLFEFGSRLGLVSGQSQVVAAWTDTRNSILPKQQDVFAARIVLPAPGGAAPGTPPLAVLAGGFTLVGVALVLWIRRKGAGRSVRER